MNRKIFGYICTSVLALLMCFEIIFTSYNSVSAAEAGYYTCNIHIIKAWNNGNAWILTGTMDVPVGYYPCYGFLPDGDFSIRSFGWCTKNSDGTVSRVTGSNYSYIKNINVTASLPGSTITVLDYSEFLSYSSWNPLDVDAFDSNCLYYNPNTGEVMKDYGSLSPSKPAPDQTEGSSDGLFGSSSFDANNYKYWFFTNGNSSYDLGMDTINYSRYAINLTNDLVSTGTYTDLVGSFFYNTADDEVVLSLFYRKDGVLTPATDWYLLWGSKGLWGYTSFIHTNNNHIIFENASSTFGTRITSSNIVWYDADEQSGGSDGYLPIINDGNIITNPSQGGLSPSIGGASFDIESFLNAETMRSYLAILSGFMSFLPSWLWTLLGFSFTAFTVMAIYKFIRG